MSWHDAITEGLPAGQGGGPESLRRDIADELADHLDCAMQRERSRTNDEEQAKSRVLDRFGDPARLARQLWFDAMKETIMKDRMIIVAVVVMMLTSLAACGLTWASFQQYRDANQEIVDKLGGLVETLQSTRQDPGSFEWTELVVKCVGEGDDAPPLEGAIVSLNGEAINPTKTLELQETTKTDGTVRFGLIRPGEYYLSIDLNGLWQFYRPRSIVVMPGELNELTIECPATTPVKTEVVFTIGVPDEFNEDIFFYCRLRTGRRHVESDRWQWSGSRQMLEGFRIDSVGKVTTTDGKRELEKIAVWSGPNTLEPGVCYARDKNQKWSRLCSLHDTEIVFEALPNTLNRCEIKLTDAQVEQVREGLANLEQENVEAKSE